MGIQKETPLKCLFFEYSIHIFGCGKDKEEAKDNSNALGFVTQHLIGLNQKFETAYPVIFCRK